ncbi:hypothetical protein [Kouleothrix sp.]|uniref:hypothetical protein n=1 Tax=Kouleothrix sp. TaxID=2779161 RepID=UPI00391B5B89
MAMNSGPRAQALRLGPSAASVGRFLWHLLQMIMAMELGMAAYHALLHTALAGSGYAALTEARPLFGYWMMVVSMTLPMIALMRYAHKSSWRACGEMSVAMAMPSAALTLLLLGGLIDLPALQALGDPLMILAMAADMLYRRDAHTHGHASHAPSRSRCEHDGAAERD